VKLGTLENSVRYSKWDHLEYTAPEILFTHPTLTVTLYTCALTKLSDFPVPCVPTNAH